MLVRTFRNNLDAHASAIEAAGSPRDRYVRIATAIAWCGEATARVDKTMSGALAAFRNMWERWHANVAPANLPVRRVEPYASASRAFYSAAAGYLCLEVAFSALLCAYYFRMPVAAAVPFGIVIAVCFALAMKGLPASLIAANDRSPAEVRQKLTSLLWMLGPPHAVLMTALALSRSGGAVGDVLNTWFDPLAAVLSVFTPILAGITMVAGIYYGWSARAEAEYIALESLRGDIVVFKAECEECLAQLALDTPEPARRETALSTHRDGHGVGAAGAVVLSVAIAAASLTVAAPVQAQSPPVIAIDIDASRSVDRPAAERVVLGSIDAVAGLADATSAGEIDITTFASDGFTAAPRARIVWPPPEGSTCAPFEPSDTARLIRHRYDVEHAAWTRDCEQRQKSAHEARQRVRASAVADLRTQLTAAVRATQPGCTALWDRLMSAAQRRRATFEVIFSDAEETCTQLKPVPAPRADVRVVLVVLPPAAPRRRGPTEAERFARVGSELAASRWITVVTPIDWPLAIDAAADKGER